MFNFVKDILVIGTGDKYSKINPSVPKWLIQNKISNFEILPTVLIQNLKKFFFNFLFFNKGKSDKCI